MSIRLINFLNHNKKYILLFLAGTSISFVVGYLVSENFRIFLKNKNYDANFVFAFIASLSLLVTLLEGAKHRRFTFNINLQNRVTDNALKVVGKLLTINSKANTLYETQKRYKEAIADKTLYIDQNNVLSKDDIDDGIEYIAAVVQTHFSEIGDDWNNIQNLLSQLATNTTNIIKNYEANIKLILDGVDFKNPVLDDIDKIIDESEKIYTEIANVAPELAEKVLKPVRENENKIRSNF